MSPFLCFVDFWADKCGPRRMAAPEVARTAAEMAGKLWCVKWIPREYPTLAVRFNVRGIPNFAVFSGGRLVMQQAGAVDHDQMNQWLRAAAAVSA
jgi:thioredoxin 2